MQLQNPSKYYEIKWNDDCLNIHMALYLRHSTDFIKELMLRLPAKFHTQLPSKLDPYYYLHCWCILVKKKKKMHTSAASTKMYSGAVCFTWNLLWVPVAMFLTQLRNWVAQATLACSLATYSLFVVIYFVHHSLTMALLFGTGAEERGNPAAVQTDRPMTQNHLLHASSMTPSSSIRNQPESVHGPQSRQSVLQFSTMLYTT